MSNRCFSFRSIGVVHSPYREHGEAPPQGVFAPEGQGVLEIYPEYAEGLSDCAGFSHLYVIWVFDRSSGYSLRCVPYRETQKRGVFSTRAPRRPNPIGLSVVRLLAVRGNRLEIAELDMLDGTPILDIKPYICRLDARTEACGGWFEGLADGTNAGKRSPEGHV